MAQGGGHSLDPATAAAFPRRGALRLPLLPARRIGGCCARKFLESECLTIFIFVRQRMAEPMVMSEVFWQRLAEQDWFGILYPEEAGGAGWGWSP